MRVAIDARLLAYQRAGTATYIRGIIQGLAGQAGEIQPLVLRSRKDDGAGLHAVTSYHVWTPPHHRWERWTLGAELFGGAIRSHRLDVVHSPDFIPPARFGQRWARVITVHDLAFLRYPELLTEDSLRYYGQIFQAVREAERIIAVSEATRRDLLELVDQRIGPKVTVIPEGVESDFRPLDPGVAARRVQERFGIDRPYFLFVGTLEPRKNLPRLIRAFAIARARLGAPAPLLILAGSRGWLADDLTDVAKPLGDAVRFLGRVESADLVALYNAALALALVSLYEGFGLPALEAMACGRPTLVADAASLPEVVGEAGLRVDPTDEEAIAAGLQRLGEDARLRNELGARGLERARRFNWPDVGRRTAQVYREARQCAC